MWWVDVTQGFLFVMGDSDVPLLSRVGDAGAALPVAPPRQPVRVFTLPAAPAVDEPVVKRANTRHAVPKRSMGWWQLSAFAYVNICGGPFGMESAVNAGGALLTLIAIGVVSLLWAAPQSVMTAEMSTAFAVNGGMVVVRATATMPLFVLWYWRRRGVSPPSSACRHKFLPCAFA